DGAGRGNVQLVGAVVGGVPGVGAAVVRQGVDLVEGADHLVVGAAAVVADPVRRAGIGRRAIVRHRDGVGLVGDRFHAGVVDEVGRRAGIGDCELVGVEAA